jgi:hypothetical protein
VIGNFVLVLQIHYVKYSTFSQNDIEYLQIHLSITRAKRDFKEKEKWEIKQMSRIKLIA